MNSYSFYDSFLLFNFAEDMKKWSLTVKNVPNSSIPMIWAFWAPTWSAIHFWTPKCINSISNLTVSCMCLCIRYLISPIKNELFFIKALFFYFEIVLLFKRFEPILRKDLAIWSWFFNITWNARFLMLEYG